MDVCRIRWGPSQALELLPCTPPHPPTHPPSTCLSAIADVMRFLLAHIDELGGVAEQNLEQLGLLTGG